MAEAVRARAAAVRAAVRARGVRRASRRSSAGRADTLLAGRPLRLRQPRSSRRRSRKGRRMRRYRQTVAPLSSRWRQRRSWRGRRPWQVGVGAGWRATGGISTCSLGSELPGRPAVTAAAAEGSRPFKGRALARSSRGDRTVASLGGHPSRGSLVATNLQGMSGGDLLRGARLDDGKGPRGGFSCNLRCSHNRDRTTSGHPERADETSKRARTVWLSVMPAANAG